MRVRDHLGISQRRQAQLTRVMEASLVGMLFIGLFVNSPGIVVNAGVGILVTQLVPALERDYGIPMDPALVLWITAAVFLHALGTVPLPADWVDAVGSVEAGQDRASLYKSSGWWDHMTHALSSSVVAAAGYATVRALDEHDDGIVIPPRFTFVFVVLFVLAFGVLWEVLEFAIGGGAELLGTGSVLTQYGVEDTLLDLFYNSLGAVVVGVWGTAYLTDVVGAIERRLDSGSWDEGEES
jgi:hypothetical protein